LMIDLGQLAHPVALSNDLALLCILINNGGVSILNFTISHELVIVNSYFKKKEDHLVTFKSGAMKTQIDFFLIRVHNRRMCIDYKVRFSE